MIDFDPNRLEQFLSERFGAAPMHLARIAGGQSNPSYLLDWGTHRFVLRKQPNGPILKGAHAIDREYLVLQALSPTDFPIPRPVLFHPDAALLGTPFYVMERVEGRVFTDTTLPELPKSARKAVWMAVAETLAAMHAIRPDDVGLAQFGRPGNYFERQIARWDRQYRASPSGPIPEIEALYDWLVAHMPEDDGRISLCHGDFRLGNLMFHHEEPRVVAVLDWELSTLGHPLADLGFCAMAWHTEPAEYGGLLGTALDDLGLPDQSDFVERYMAASPDPRPLLPFHIAFALYRFAVIFVGIADRAQAGSAADPQQAAELGPLAKRFARRGMETAEARPHVLSRQA